MNSPHQPDFESLVRLAAEHTPDTSRAELGFETRLMARLRETSAAGRENVLSFWDELQRWAWGGAASLAPVAIVLGAWLWFSSGTSLSPFSYDAVSQLTEYFSIGSF